jgi:hypothetical protein
MFENIIRKQLNADAQETAAERWKPDRSSYSDTKCTACKPLMMILTGALTNVMLLLTQRRKRKV